MSTQTAGAVAEPEPIAATSELLLIDLSSIAHPVFDAAFVRRFATRVKADDKGCWLWTGAVDRKGYGAVCHRRRMLKTHRVAWHLRHGSPAGQLVCHACDVPACLNPSHLFLGTASDNSADMMAKGRHRTASTFGTANGGAKIAPPVVHTVRSLRGAGLSHRQIAARVGISASQVGNILSGKHWGWM